ncbi:MAG: hypothetical protein MHM6MM_005953 [Cercozoa sp. M6MM]
MSLRDVVTIKVIGGCAVALHFTACVVAWRDIHDLRKLTEDLDDYLPSDLASDIKVLAFALMLCASLLSLTATLASLVSIFLDKRLQRRHVVACHLVGMVTGALAFCWWMGASVYCGAKFDTNANAFASSLLSVMTSLAISWVAWLRWRVERQSKASS